MTLRPSAPWWSERSRRTRHRLALTGNRPADRVAGSLRTAHSRDPPLPPNVIRAGQRPGAGPTPLARDTAARRPQHSRRGAGRGHPNAGRNEMETRDADGSWRAFKQRSRTTSCCPGTFLPHAVSSPGGLVLGLPFGTGVFRAGRTLAQVSLHPRPFRVTTLPPGSSCPSRSVDEHPPSYHVRTSSPGPAVGKEPPHDTPDAAPQRGRTPTQKPRVGPNQTSTVRARWGCHSQ
jgi:hypothetical protein